MDTQAYYYDEQTFTRDYKDDQEYFESELKRLKQQYEQDLQKLNNRMENNKKHYEKCIYNINNPKFQNGQAVKVKESYVKKHMSGSVFDELPAYHGRIAQNFICTNVYTFKNLVNIGTIQGFMVRGNGSKYYEVTFKDFEYIGHFDKTPTKDETFRAIIAERYLEAV